jgi:DNA-binding transcriptional LysR family regulator
MLDPRRLRLLVEVQRRGTIAAAARAAGYTPSAVSQQLATLERESGVVLFERDGRRVRPTPAAVLLATRAESILRELEAAELELVQDREVLAGPLAAAAFPTAAELLLVPALRALVKSHPGLQPHISQLLPEEGIARLRAGGLDLVVAKSYDGVPAPASGGLDRSELLTEPLLVALPARRRVGGPEVRLADLKEELWIAGDAGSVFGEVVRRACLAAGFEPQIVHRAEELSIQLSLVAAGLGVALIPQSATGAPTRGVRFASVTGTRVGRQIYALTRRGAAKRPEVRALLEALQQEAEGLAA